MLGDLDALNRFAQKLAAGLRAGDILALRGPLGAGKTALARAIIRHCLDEPDLDVPSPTFTLVQTYAGPRFDIWHVDLYRISTPQDCLELGLDEAFGDAVAIIEWPERLGADLPERRVDITIEPLSDGTRRIDVRRH